MPAESYTLAPQAPRWLYWFSALLFVAACFAVFHTEAQSAQGFFSRLVLVCLALGITINRLVARRNF